MVRPAVDDEATGEEELKRHLQRGDGRKSWTSRFGAPRAGREQQRAHGVACRTCVCVCVCVRGWHAPPPLTGHLQPRSSQA